MGCGHIHGRGRPVIRQSRAWEGSGASSGDCSCADSNSACPGDHHAGGNDGVHRTRRASGNLGCNSRGCRYLRGRCRRSRSGFTHSNRSWFAWAANCGCRFDACFWCCPHGLALPHGGIDVALWASSSRTARSCHGVLGTRYSATVGRSSGCRSHGRGVLALDGCHLLRGWTFPGSRLPFPIT